MTHRDGAIGRREAALPVSRVGSSMVTITIGIKRFILAYGINSKQVVSSGGKPKTSQQRRHLHIIVAYMSLNAEKHGHMSAKELSPDFAVVSGTIFSTR